MEAAIIEYNFRKKLMEEQLTPEFKKAAVEVARLFELADVDRWEDLPDGVRGFISVVEYRVLVKPLVYRDRCNLSWPQLSIKYGLTVQEVRTICKKAYYRANIRVIEKKAVTV